MTHWRRPTGRGFGDEPSPGACGLGPTCPFIIVSEFRTQKRLEGLDMARGENPVPETLGRFEWKTGRGFTVRRWMARTRSARTRVPRRHCGDERTGLPARTCSVWPSSSSWACGPTRAASWCGDRRERVVASSPMQIRPPTIAHLQSQGVAGAWVTCRNPVCLRSTPLSFKAIGLAPETHFLAITRARRFFCAGIPLPPP